MSFYDDEFFEEEEDRAYFDDFHGYSEELSDDLAVSRALDAEFPEDPDEEFLMENPPPEVHYVEYFFAVLKAWCGLNAYDATMPYVLSMQLKKDAKQRDYYYALRDVTDGQYLKGLAAAAGHPYVPFEKFQDGPEPILNPGLIAIIYHMQETTLVNQKVLEKITISSDIMSTPDDYGDGNTDIDNAYEVALSIWGYSAPPVWTGGKAQAGVLGLPLRFSELYSRANADDDPYEAFYNLLVKKIPHLLYQLLEHMPFEAWCNYTREVNPFLKEDIDLYWMKVLITEMGDSIDLWYETRQRDQRGELYFEPDYI